MKGTLKLKKSRLHGVNRTSSYYRATNIHSKWLKVRRSKVRYIGLTNEDRLSPISNITKNYSRVRGRPRMRLFNRLYWKAMYPGVNVRNIRFDRHGDRRQPMVDNSSLLTSVEMRMDVLLWRSGLVASIPMARQLVLQGHVVLYDMYKQNVVSPIHPGILIDSTKAIWIRTNLNTQENRTKWADKAFKHKLPPYRMVDYEQSLIIPLRHPKDGEIYVPSYLPIRLEGLKIS